MLPCCSARLQKTVSRFIRRGSRIQFSLISVRKKYRPKAVSSPRSVLLSSSNILDEPFTVGEYSAREKEGPEKKKDGPCPPRGKPHRYFFKLYALDAKLSLKAGATKDEVEQAMKGLSSRKRNSSADTAAELRHCVRGLASKE